MQPIKKHRSKYAAPIGGIFVILAVIGIITVIITSIGLTRTALDNSKEKERFEHLIRPVLMFDPVPFESPTQVEMSKLLLYSMWGTLSSERAVNYAYNENQELVIPASDLEVSAANLFGSEIKLEHQTFSDYESSYIYNGENNSYNVRISAQLYVYSPVVRDITKEGDLFKLEVYYMPPSDAWSTVFAGGAHSPFVDKTMYYYLSKTSGNYHIAKVENTPTEAPIS